MTFNSLTLGSAAESEVLIWNPQEELLFEIQMKFLFRKRERETKAHYGLCTLNRCLSSGSFWGVD